VSFQRYPAYKDSGIEWLGEVPSHWAVLRLGQIGRLSKGNGGTKQDETDAGVPCVRYGDLYTTHRYFIRGSRSCISPERAPDYTSIQCGDVLFAASGETIEEIGKSAVNLLESEAVCGGDVIVLRPTATVEPLFLGFALDSPEANAQKAGMGRGFTVVHIYADQLRTLGIAFPSLSEQSAIGAFLDRETAKIDALVAEYRTLIELLKEKRQAVISHAVTEGLDPTVPMKDSGVEWLGEVPGHWRVVPLKYLVAFRSGGTPSKENMDYWDGDVPWASAKDLKAEILGDTTDHITEYAIASGAADLVPAGSVLVVVRGMILARTFPVAVTAVPMAINQDLKALVSPTELAFRFLARCLQASSEESSRRIDEAGHGTKALRMDVWTSIEFPVPPIPEQEELVTFLDYETAKLDALVSEADQAITLLQERRTALISAAVTGKVDVRALVQQEAA